MIYRLIKGVFTSLSLRRRCRVAGVSPSAYYAWEGELSRCLDETALVEQIRAVLTEYPAYGYRRVTRELQRRRQVVNKKRIQRLMQVHGLQCKRKRRFVRTTDSNHTLPVYPNLINAMNLDRPNCVWAADITYVRLLHGFVYVAVILDLFSRKVIGWALSRSLRAQLTVQALRMAFETRPVVSGLVHHSDRGVQYASDEYVSLLNERGIRISMSRKGNPYDNAKVESFMKTLKTEEVYLNEYDDELEARTNIGAFIETMYNNKRLHSSLGYRSPDEFEDLFHSHQAA